MGSFHLLQNLPGRSQQGPREGEAGPQRERLEDPGQWWEDPQDPGVPVWTAGCPVVWRGVTPGPPCDHGQGALNCKGHGWFSCLKGPLVCLCQGGGQSPTGRASQPPTLYWGPVKAWGGGDISAGTLMVKSRQIQAPILAFFF